MSLMLIASAISLKRSAKLNHIRFALPFDRISIERASSSVQETLPFNLLYFLLGLANDDVEISLGSVANTQAVEELTNGNGSPKRWNAWQPDHSFSYLLHWLLIKGLSAHCSMKLFRQTSKSKRLADATSPIGCFW